MTPEERFELHEQWRMSMDTSHKQSVARMAALDLRVEQLTQILGVVRRSKAVLFTAMAMLAMNLERLSGGNGQQPN